MIEDAINKPGVIVDRWVLRLGKDGEEAGKFAPWFLPSNTFEKDLESFLACLNLLKLHEAVKERMALQKKGVREIKKQQRVEQKALDKAEAKAKRAQEKAQLKLDRAAEKERIKADAKKAREEAKLAKHNPEVPKSVPVPIAEAIENALADNRLEGLPTPSEAVVKVLTTLYEDFPVERKPYVIPEGG
jgi:hypothetical protein